MVDKKIEDSGKILGGGVNVLGAGAQGFNKDFMDFLQKYQVIGLAVAVVIGAAATKLVNSIVADIIMPIVGVVTPFFAYRIISIQPGKDPMRYRYLMND